MEFMEVNMKKLTKITRYALLLGLLLSSNMALAMRGGQGQGNPWGNMNYDRAFNPDRFKEFKQLMKEWGCYENVFGSTTNKSAEPTSHDDSAEAASSSAGTGGSEACHSGYAQVPTEDRTSAF